MSTPPIRFDRSEYCAANLQWGCNCVPVALAAILGLRLSEVRRFVPEVESGKGVAVNKIPSVLDRAQVRWRARGGERFNHGLAVIRFDDVPDPCHCVAVSDGKLLDTTSVTAGKNWCDVKQWERKMLPHVAKFLGAKGECRVYRGFEIER